jgi:hypothetical protein
MGFASVLRVSFESLLTAGGVDGDGMGKAVTIAVGGTREPLEVYPNTMRVVLRDRQVFVKLALRRGQIWFRCWRLRKMSFIIWWIPWTIQSFGKCKP